MTLLIIDFQSDIVLGRLITDNTLISFENFPYLKKKRRGHKTYMALKLDMSKVYDKVDWRFLNHVLFQLGFPAHFVSTIMRLVSSISYSIVINGDNGDAFTP